MKRQGPMDVFDTRGLLEAEFGPIRAMPHRGPPAVVKLAQTGIVSTVRRVEGRPPELLKIQLRFLRAEPRRG